MDTNISINSIIDRTNTNYLKMDENINWFLYPTFDLFPSPKAPAVRGRNTPGTARALFIDMMSNKFNLT